MLIPRSLFRRGQKAGVPLTTNWTIIRLHAAYN